MRMRRSFVRFPALLSILLSLGLLSLAAADSRSVMLVDFESGSAPLESYSSEDQEPDRWEIQSEITHDDSDYALRVWGNSWKALTIPDLETTEQTVLAAAIYTDEVAEMNAIGFADGLGNVIYYCVHGTQMSLHDRWNIVFQGSRSTEAWHVYQMPVGRDWLDTFGYCPTINCLVFVNDHDSSGDGETIYDDICDVTLDRPIEPQVEIQHYVQRVEKIESHGRAGDPLYRMSVQFSAQVYDPDSPAHSYSWDFGDGSTSSEPAPVHLFEAQANYTFTIALDVTDEAGLLGRDTCQVAVEPGEPNASCTINFTGDVFMGRNYEIHGGLIDTYGVEYLWEPTRAILGDLADVTMVNAECAFTDGGEPHPTKSVVFRTSPENIAGLVYAGVDVASLGNNHIIDYGLEGMEQTFSVFDSAGIVYGGAGVDEYFALQPCYYSVEGIRLGFINFCNRTGRADFEQPFFDAGCGKYGLGYWLEPNNARAIAQAESLADIVIAYPHSGIEYESSPPRSEGGPPAGTPIDVELCPPYVDEAEARDFQFRVWPGLSDRELRRHAIDCGADAVINNHPHVLQGFEVYEGCLIAHSLGNFMFDLYYPETMPTIILRARFDKEGIDSWTFLPVFIDRWIPRPATGRLGREILDRMADYSRVFGTLVGVDVPNVQGRVYLDPGEAMPVTTPSAATSALQPGDSPYVSEPIELAGNGSLSQVLEIGGISSSGAEIRVGREVLWFGGFEIDEGHSMWDLNSEDEYLDQEVPHSGRYCLEQMRGSHDMAISTALTRHLPAADSLEYSILGWVETENARDASLALRFYRGRYDQTPLETFDAMTPLDGTHAYSEYSSDVRPPENTTFFNVRCRLDAPASGDAFARFDDLRVVEWLDWQPADSPLAIDYPNNFRYVQIRTPELADSVTVLYEETVMAPTDFSALPDYDRHTPVRVALAGAAPNPCFDETLVRYRLSGAARVSLEVFDLNGRRVASLVKNETQRAGWHRVPWKAEKMEAGVYFMRLTVDGDAFGRKIVVMH